ncbi:formate/nitrite transporter family protein, partial [Vibrio parahaemolyticus V-223/04]
SLAV